MRKSTTRGQKTTSTAGVVHPVQSTVALNKGTDKPFRRLVTPEMIDAVSPILQKIDETLTQEKRTTRSIGLQLRQLRDGIANYFRESGTAVSDKRINGAFAFFVRVRFKIKNSRLNEYMRLAERTDLRDLDCSLSISVLIELSRLDVAQLAVFMEKHPIDELEQLQFKDIKKLVRDSNGNSRTVAAKTAKVQQLETQQALAGSLKSTFAKVADQVGNENPLDKDLESVLMDISFWYISRKRAA